MKCKTYLSDVGFGHLVRQRAIFEEIVNHEPGMSVTVQTGVNVEMAKRMFSSAELINRFNNIEWSSRQDGSPDLEKIKNFFNDYKARSEGFIKRELNFVGQYDLIISDFVYEAFYLARKNKIPAFGVAHFTWDWFFSKLYPPPVSYELITRMQELARMARVVYFPPFTPREILAFYGDLAFQVPFIVRTQSNERNVQKTDKFTILIMDSGAGVLKQHLSVALEQIEHIPDVHFLISSRYDIIGDNITQIPDTHFFSDYIPDVDLVITRGGFNVISECIAHRTPILLIGENCNPEIEQNLLAVKREQLGSFISLERFVYFMEDTLRSFIDNEYMHIKRRMEEHEHEINGAEVVAKDILNRMADKSWLSSL